MVIRCIDTSYMIFSRCFWSFQIFVLHASRRGWTRGQFKIYRNRWFISKRASILFSWKHFGDETYTLSQIPLSGNSARIDDSFDQVGFSRLGPGTYFKEGESGARKPLDHAATRYFLKVFLFLNGRDDDFEAKNESVASPSSLTRSAASISCWNSCISGSVANSKHLAQVMQRITTAVLAENIRLYQL